MTRLVVVDDDRDVCELVGKALVRAGHDVVTCQTGEQALELLDVAGAPCDCLVVDKLLPGLGGLEVIARARATHPGLPVVLMTGHPEPFQLGDARPNVVLTKPFERLDVITDAVRTALEQRPVAPVSLKDRVAAVVAELAPALVGPKGPRQE